MKVEVEILTKSPSMISLSGHVAKKPSVSSLKDQYDSMVLRSSAAAGPKKFVSPASGESLKKTRKTKAVGEVVETSVDGEAEWI
jgi:hypothetical protein